MVAVKCVSHSSWSDFHLRVEIAHHHPDERSSCGLGGRTFFGRSALLSHMKPPLREAPSGCLPNSDYSLFSWRGRTEEGFGRGTLHPLPRGLGRVPRTWNSSFVAQIGLPEAVDASRR
jgi:hypothetical protein